MGKIARALVSVSDKRGIVDFCRELAKLNVEILSTGGTAAALRGANVPVTDVAEYTGSPEVMDGRVKTLHPRVHGGILMRDTIQDRTQLTELGGKSIDLVVVNLYPFEETVARKAPYDEAIENIDIGGPSMIRSAAKNHARVAVVVEPSDYETVLGEIKSSGDVSITTRKALAAKAFSQTARYDGAIAAYLTSFESDGSQSEFPSTLTLQFARNYTLRYGENPHQSAAFYREIKLQEGALAFARSLGTGAKELSFNNIVDVDAALEAVLDFSEPCAVVVKHTNPSGVATAASVREAFIRAREADPVSAFGGIVALNRRVEKDTAEALIETFLECVVAPDFSDEALALLQSKKNLRILATGVLANADRAELQIKRVSGGMVVQTRDVTAEREISESKLASKRAPTEREKAALGFAWRVSKHVKSNAIVLAAHEQNELVTVGVGAGQMSRVVSVDIAVQKAGAKARGSVLASDAFFPFPDGVEAAAKAGVTAMIQPGGSMRDADIIAAADAHNIAMLFTGTRHFRH